MIENDVEKWLNEFNPKLAMNIEHYNYGDDELSQY